ncbi:hypothetical protein [Nocardia testacea]|uniref:hypothetical protein n=1 Tax=Nocardia testacea TaxID=248551 RepID=UPI003A8BF169
MRLGDFDATGDTGGHPVQQTLAGGHRVRTVVRDTGGPDRPRTSAAPAPDATFRTALAEPAAIGHSILRGY